MFTASAVLPIEGRPAMTMRSEFWNPAVFSSKSAKPVDTPVMGLVCPESSSMRALAPSNSGSTRCGPAPCRRSSEMRNTACSARDSKSPLGRPSGA